MKTNTLKWLVGLGALGSSLASCSQPAVECQVELAQNYPYAARFIAKSTPTCSIPGFVQAGDLIGLEFYHPPTADKSTYDDTKATVAIESDWLGNVQALYNGFSCTPAACSDLGVNCGAAADGCGALALADDGTGDCGKCPSGQTCGGGGTPNMCGAGTCTPKTCQDLGYDCGFAGDGCGMSMDCGKCSGDDTCGGNGLFGVCGHLTLDSAASDTVYTTGRFTTPSPDSGDLCHTADLVSSQQTFGSGPTTTGSFPSANVSGKYDWSNFNVYVNADAQGTQFSADVHVSETLNGTTCEIDYHVIGVWPAVECTTLDADGNVVLDAMGNSSAAADLCNPCAEPDKGRPTGSGLNQAFPIECAKIFAEDDPFGRHPYWCVLKGTKDPPQRLDTPLACE